MLLAQCPSWVMQNCARRRKGWNSSLAGKAAPPQLRHVSAAANTGRDGQQQQPFDDRTRRALREAGEILAEAQEQAQQQALSELMSSWQADALGDPTNAAAAADPSPQAALEAFLIEQGLSTAQTDKLITALRSETGFRSCLNTQVLSQKLSSLQRVLPDAPVAQLLLDEPQLLLASSNQMVTNLVSLVNAMPGRDVMGMIARRPRLLLVDDMQDRLQRIFSKLVSLHPSHSSKVVAGLIAENPDLLFRMDYYLSEDVRLLDDLPIEIQNMMVLGDHGIGYLYKYWNNRLTEPSSQQEWDSSSSSSSSAA